jgi:lipoate---protein ligase
VQPVSGIVVVHHRGSARSLHDLDPFADGPVDSPKVWLCSVDASAIVLGSRQRPEILDLDMCARAGLEVVRRRSGGGAVLLRPHAVVWIDLVLPPGSVPDDIRASMVWAGERWRDALGAVGAVGDRMLVHRGGMVASPWSDLVCFAGVGPGEVLVDGRKLVGLSQRRTRNGIRVQGQVHRRGLVHEMPPLFTAEVPDAVAPDPAVLGDVGLSFVADDELAAALAAALVASTMRTTPM